MDIMSNAINKEADRREKARFPIHRELRFKVLQDATVLEVGTGETLNISSGGVLFSLERDLQAGCFVELSISWPVLLDNTCPMRMIAFGRVLRSEGGVTACTIDKYEFRTQARAAVRPITLNRSDSMLQRWANGVRKESLKASLATA
jgi:hypothetical protein